VQVLNQLKLKILTPNGTFYDDTIEIVTIKTTEGNIGILHGHIPLVASIVISELHINDQSSKNYIKCAISGGLLCVEPEQVTIITDAIETQSNIDIARARIAETMAKRILAQKNLEAPIEFSARYALLKALNRIKLKEEK
jgi:F-type H+-transporting ATPase subunit epsilon